MSTPTSTEGSQLLDSLLIPGKHLVFVDDSGTHGKQLDALAGDFECLCGLEMRSEDHSRAREMAPNMIQMIPHGIEEFHANEIVNPNDNSPWRTVPHAERAECLRGLFGIIEACCPRIYYGFYSGEQMRATPEMISRPEIMAKGPKAAVEKVFRGFLVPHLLNTATQPVMVWDSVKPATTQMKVESLRQPDAANTCEIIHADSRYVFGLQLADLVVYAYNRLHRIRHRAMQGISHAMDVALLDGLLLLKGRFVDVLRLPE